MLPREQGKNAKVAQDKLKEIRESRDIPEDQKGFVAEEYMKNNHPQQWNMIQAGVQARQQSQQGEQPVGLLNSGQPGGQGIPPTPQVNGGRSGPQPGLLSMAGISPPLPQPVPQQSGSGGQNQPLTDLIGNSPMDYQNKLNAAKLRQQGLPNARIPNDVNIPVDQGAMADQFSRAKQISYNDGMADGGAIGNVPTPTPAEEPVPGQPGIFSRIVGGLKSAGKGMGDYSEKLFNDPNRMAMLQGGLSMMNPNSYYDKQGFGSVFQGLETGLGQAQSGMAGVIARKKARAEIAKTKAEAQWKTAGGPNKLPASYLQVLNRWQKETDPDMKSMLHDRLQVLGRSPEYAGLHARSVSKNKELGKGSGEAAVSLQTAEDSYAYMTDVVSRLINHPGLKGVVGVPSVLGLTHAPGTPEADFRALQAQVAGGVFLRAFQDLKGGGHITEIEGNQAKESLARMSAAQTQEGFKTAMNEYLAILDKGIKAHRQKAKGDLSGTPSKFKAREEKKSEYNPLGLPAEKL